MLRTTLLAVLLGALMTGCVVYKIEQTEQFQSGDYRGSSDGRDVELISPHVVRVNKIGEGAHCFEPMLYVLTIGIIPTHCVSKYHVARSSRSLESTESLETHFIVTSMQGWAALFLPLSPRWQFGYAEKAVLQIERLAEQKQ